MNIIRTNSSLSVKRIKEELKRVFTRSVRHLVLVQSE